MKFSKRFKPYHSFIILGMKSYEVEHSYNEKSYKFDVREGVLADKANLTKLSDETLGYLNRFLSYHPDFFYIFDSDYNFRYVSPSLLKLWNKKFAEAKGKGFKDLGYPPELISLHEKQLDLAFSNKIVHGENEFENEQGKVGYYEYIFVPLTDDNGKVKFVGGVTRDISHRKESERRRQELIYTISHDLKNPLNAIVGAAQLLEPYVTDEKAKEYVQILMRNAHRMEELICGILDSAAGKKMPGLNTRLLDITEVVEEAVEYLQTAYGDRFIYRKLKTPICGMYDPFAIYRIVENLGQNAIKYGDKNSPVTIEVRPALDKEVRLSVHNKGKAIDKKKFNQIFQMFGRDKDTHQSKKGWGIGLATVANLVRAHGGRVELESSEDHGTTFTAILPYDS